MFASQQVIYLLHIFRPIRHIVGSNATTTFYNCRA